MFVKSFSLHPCHEPFMIKALPWLNCVFILLLCSCFGLFFLYFWSRDTIKMNISSINYSFPLWYYKLLSYWQLLRIKVTHWLESMQTPFWRELLPWWIVISELHWSWLFIVVVHVLNSESNYSELNKLTQFSLSETENSEFPISR